MAKIEDGRYDSIANLKKRYNGKCGICVFAIEKDGQIVGVESRYVADNEIDLRNEAEVLIRCCEVYANEEYNILDFRQTAS